MLVFTIFGRPRPQAQNRTVPVMYKRADGTKEVAMRTTLTGALVPMMLHPNPAQTVNWRSDAKLAALKAVEGLPPAGVVFKGAVCMDVDIYLARPKRLIWKKRPMPPCPATASPDRSNVMKSLEDALEGIVYRNDAQIADGRVRKLYAAGPGYGDERPRTEVRISEIKEDGDEVAFHADGSRDCRLASRGGTADSLF